MTTRKTKPTIAATPFVETVTPQAAAPDTEESYNERFFAGIKEMLANGPTWKRILTAWAIGLATSIGLGYLGGQAAAVLAISAAVLTGSVFIFWLTYVVGLVLAIYASYRASVFIHFKVIDKTVDRLAASAWDKTTSLFNFRGAQVQS